MVVPVLMTSCQVSLNAKSGPETAQTTITPMAMQNAAGRPVARDTPFAKPAAARVRESGELLWTLQKDHVAWSCELKWPGESYGWQRRFFAKGNS